MRYIGVLALGTLLVITGCAPSAADPVEPSASAESEDVSVNEEPCNDFGVVTSKLATVLNGDGSTEAWEQLRVDLDSASLAADGDVKDRLTAFVDAWPSNGDAYVYEDARVLMNEHIEGIDRACAADGIDVTVYTFRND